MNPVCRRSTYILDEASLSNTPTITDDIAHTQPQGSTAAIPASPVPPGKISPAGVSPLGSEVIKSFPSQASGDDKVEAQTSVSGIY